MNIGKNALPAATVSMLRSRISFTSRSCNVPFARSTRPLACEELAQMMSMLSACRARPKWVIPSPPPASFGLRAGELHNLAPLFGFLNDQLAEVSGRTRKHRAAEVSEPRFHVGIGESRIDLLVECVDGLS